MLAYDRKELVRDAQGKLITLLGRRDQEAAPDHRRGGARRERADARPIAMSSRAAPNGPRPNSSSAIRPSSAARTCAPSWATAMPRPAGRSRPDVPGGADFVMHFWDEAARRLTAKPAKKGSANPLRRFGFITTNSITQTFSRRVVERCMAAKEPLSLVYAVPDHPWMKSADKAAVRIAMTVAQAGNHEGVLAEVVSEAELNTDTPKVELERREGKVDGETVGSARICRSSTPLLANELLASQGCQALWRSASSSRRSSRRSGWDR